MIVNRIKRMKLSSINRAGLLDTVSRVNHRAMNFTTVDTQLSIILVFTSFLLYPKSILSTPPLSQKLLSSLSRNIPQFLIKLLFRCNVTLIQMIDCYSLYSVRVQTHIYRYSAAAPPPPPPVPLYCLLVSRNFTEHQN